MTFNAKDIATLYLLNTMGHDRERTEAEFLAEAKKLKILTRLLENVFYAGAYKGALAGAAYPEEVRTIPFEVDEKAFLGAYEIIT